MNVARCMACFIRDEELVLVLGLRLRPRRPVLETPHPQASYAWVALTGQE